MRRVFTGLAMAALVLVGIPGCRSAKVLPIADAPSGVLQFHFTRKVEGPIELTLDGTRIPVEEIGKKGYRQLLITGLASGKHRYFLSSPRESFGPDLGEVELSAQNGIRMEVFAQKFAAVLYGNPEPLPAAEGLPGVHAVLQK